MELPQQGGPQHLQGGMWNLIGDQITSVASFVGQQSISGNSFASEVASSRMIVMQS